jgi:hypothetical protein
LDRLAHNWIGKPISDVRDKRLKALQAAEQNAHVDGHASDDRVTEARAALNEAASGLQRRHGWPVRVYCWFFGYDLEAAASCLITLHSTTGNYRYGDEARQLFVDAIYMFLRADKHLSPERIDEIKRRMILGKASI